MSLIVFVVGLAIPATIGTCALRLCEGNSPVLQPFERYIMGLIVGSTLAMFCVFLLHLIGLTSISLLSMLSIQLLLCGGLLSLVVRKKYSVRQKPETPPAAWQWTRTRLVVTGILAVWVLGKIIFTTFTVTALPLYADDAFDNWNLRAKEHLHTQELLTKDSVVEFGIRSYPPTVPLLKTWLSQLWGRWNESLANSMHALWYACSLGLLFFFLRRVSTMTAALLGVYLLSSVPLYTIHGASAYADQYLSLHVFIVIGSMFSALQAEDKGVFFSHMRIAAFVTGLMILTKNEVLLLYLPPALLIFITVLFWLHKQGAVEKQECIHQLKWLGASLLGVGIPWLIFKYTNDLPFGNAKPIGGMAISFNSVALDAIKTMIFFEGNWNLLFFAIIALFAVQFRHILQSPLLLLAFFIVTVFIGQVLVFTMTPLATEAIMQTGYNRGIVHITPVLISLVTILILRMIAPQSASETTE